MRAWAALLLAAGSAVADPCDGLDEWAAGAADPPRAAADGCGLSVAIGGGRSRHCFWSFPLRDHAARGFADGLIDQIGQCGATAGTDAPVNHPDSFDLVVVQGARNRFFVSVKDKGAEGRTLVFLRAEPLQGN